MVYNSLTEAPQNLKEAIDWLMALKGDDAKINVAALGAALFSFLADKTVDKMETPALEEVKHVTKKFLDQPELRNQWFVGGLVKRYNDLINKSPGGLAKYFRVVDESDENVVKGKGITAGAIVENLGKVVHGTEIFLDDIKSPGEYESAYSSEATWSKSCTQKPEDCAAVFVGIAPMLYAGVRSLHYASIADTLNWAPSTEQELSLRKILKALGYVEPECRAGMGGFDVAKALRGLYLRTLITLCDFTGFWAFYGSNNPDLGAGKHGNYSLSGVDFDVNMKPIDASMKIGFR
ncbi:hypothetical protein BBBOND_0400790 [Babesia bigemina]|uniref:Uncharacterized protein n=1 Tax=Babesia bigemina TaxID=5866 RepID=A0A061DC41_BABBI|nr:hypothetical protein BBBOND_0400790 [Babesia bigemina]CDR97587.1 hypothetical protein BBBOND_0400790 [Babesia bigemina]|eukprot:XP_012769773.1 hypothetical protein BBBOND_0400790 [Babesia bigemina]